MYYIIYPYYQLPGIILPYYYYLEITSYYPLVTYDYRTIIPLLISYQLLLICRIL